MNKEKYYRHTFPMMLLGCPSCKFFYECGGSFRKSIGLNCYDFCEECKADCDFLCPLKPIDFVKSYREVGGFGTQNIKNLYQNNSLMLPNFIPTLYDNNALSMLSDLEFVAMPTYIFVKLLKHENNKSYVYKKLGINKNTKILLFTIGFDKHLETLWYKINRNEFFAKLSKLDITHIVAPNFSFFLDAPRTDNLHNRKRSLICAQEMSENGLSTIPYLMAITDYDWEFWKNFLKHNTSIKYVAKELQTGGRKREVAIWHLEKLIKIQHDIKRPIHPIILGGINYIKYHGDVRFKKEIGFIKTNHFGLTTI
ncbi:MAG: hypothetical protein ACFFDN_33360 [Candidatus Hodarchaeota archaeon]